MHYQKRKESERKVEDDLRLVTKARVQEFIFGKHGKLPKKFIMGVYGAIVL